MDLSPDQENAYNSIRDWILKPNSKFITFGGYAGTGKTTLLSYIRQNLPPQTKVAFMAYTGKAASVLKRKLNVGELTKYPDDYVGTIHGAIYQVETEDGEIIGWSLKPELPYNLIFIDEASMVNEDIFNDLLTYNIPIIFTGDHGQLPPIEGTLNLMSCPQIRLEKVHRFAESNPLTKISILARMEGYVPHGEYGPLIRKVRPKDKLITEFINNSGDFLDTAIICGFNKTRIDLNQKIRDWKKIKSKKPIVGERLICLRNNKDSKDCPIYNGVSGTLKNLIDNHDHYFARIDIDGEDKPFKGKISKHSFNNEKPDMGEFTWELPSHDDFVGYDKKKKMKKVYLNVFDFSYVMTCHKSQGSEFSRVMVIEQPCQFWSGENWNKWLYTAVTRAKEELLIVR